MDVQVQFLPGPDASHLTVRCYAPQSNLVLADGVISRSALTTATSALDTALGQVPVNTAPIVVVDDTTGGGEDSTGAGG